MSNFVEIRGVTKIFPAGKGETRALDNASLGILENEFFTLLGPSGCGKTTLLRLIAGFEQPTRGDIILDGQVLGHQPPFERPVNTVFQSYALFPHLSVAENVGFGLQMQGIDAVEANERVQEMLALVKLDDYTSRLPQQLSGGQQQRVALARALANRPKVLLLDEPLSALDLKLRKVMQIELKRIREDTGITFIFVTHDQEEALTMSDRIAVMNEGRIIQVGTPTEIYEDPADRFVADFIGDTNFLDAECCAAGEGRFMLAEGVEIQAGSRNDLEPGQRVTLAIRPERAAIGDSAEALMSGTLENVVYFGTDTTYHIALAGGGRFQVRIQNRDGALRHFQVGDAVGVRIPPDAIRVLVH